MTDDYHTSEEALAASRARTDEDGSTGEGAGPYADDGTTLTGESESSAGTTDADLAEPAGE